MTRQQAFGYSMEDLRVILAPMARDAKEPVGSMGDDIPPAILSNRPRLIYDYFRQLFAQVANRPSEGSPFAAEENLIIGNVALYGATAGQAYIRGIAGERFCVRNSGAGAVVEGVGDHGCEYMTGGRAVILGPTGRNFAAGMSSGIAYVMDEAGDFGRLRCNREMVDLEEMSDPKDIVELRGMIETHFRFTASHVAERVLHDWDDMLQRFIKVMPRDYKKALKRLAEENP